MCEAARRPTLAKVGKAGIRASGSVVGAKAEAARILAAAEALRADFEALAGAASDDDGRASASRAAGRLEASVVRPLREAVGAGSADDGDGATATAADGGATATAASSSSDRPATATATADGPADTSARTGVDDGAPPERLTALSLAATELRVRAGGPPALLEATAALQDLSLQLLAADSDAAAAHREALAAAQAAVPAAVQVALDGPYLATNVEAIVDHLGVSVEPPPMAALCRCGASESKPWCDGSHAVIGFSGAKAEDRVPDQLDRYPGRQLEMTDNRGLCAHSGFCTDRAPDAFRAHEEPFVAPSGDRFDELILAARDCPSGALGYQLAGDERPGQADSERPMRIEISLDGPYRVTGGIPLEDEAGGPVPRNEGASLEHYSLCRCGKSQNKPFCSGMHWYADFHDPPPPEQATLFQWAGGFPALLRLTRRFYEVHVPTDEFLAPLFARMSPDHPERVTAWLGQVFGGPPAYSDAYGGYERMISQHLGKDLQEEWRQHWVALLARSADEVGLPADAEFRAAFAAYLEWGSRIAVENSAPGVDPPPHMPVPRWWWVCDAEPWSRAKAAPEEAEPPAVTLPGADEEVEFDPHVKQLFRPRDRDSMRFAFDLWAEDDVREHAEAILGRLREGSMPCDGSWPAEWLDVFERWTKQGGGAG
jgi:CDGSH-type Zn-finger protein/truncated hemoglobin YjbI/ferredoxin